MNETCHHVPVGDPLLELQTRSDGDEPDPPPRRMEPNRIQPAARPDIADLFESESARLQGLARAITFDDDAAGELVQDAYTNLIEHQHSVDNPAAYLQRSVVNLSINHRKRRQRFRLLPQRRARHSHIPDTDETWRALEQLSPTLRAVVALRFYEDLAHDQIAALLDIPVGTVRSRLHRALKTLKDIL